MVAGAAVAGKEDYAAWLEQRAAALPGVHWLGPRRDVGDLMADLDVFVQVSTEPEPFGLVIVEALASGVPVVAGAAGGPLEILGRRRIRRRRSGGRLVPPGDRRGPGGRHPRAPPDRRLEHGRRRARSPLRQPGGARFSLALRTGGRRTGAPQRAAAGDHVTVRSPDEGIAGRPPGVGRHPAATRRDQPLP